jgi:MSHA pilin protein MshA
MKTKQLGFTLIELVVVIVLLGIIGAVATARFQNLAADAADAVERGVAAEIASGASINYATRSLNVANGTQITGAAVDCTVVGPAMLQSGLPANVTVSNGADVDCAGGTVTCTVTHASGTATNASAVLLCIA